MGADAAAGRRRRLRGRAPLLLASIAAAVLLLPRFKTAWLGSPVGLAGAAPEAAELEPRLRRSDAGGRRDLLGGLTVAGGAALGAWAVAPSDAEAFRMDRIINAKQKYGPKIRQYFQKLDGLRDDMYIQVELGNGERVAYEARAAEWYDGVDRKMYGPLALSDSEPKHTGCKEYPPDSNAGKVLLVARGRCTFAEKMKYAAGSGAKSVLVYDEKMSKQPLDTQDKVGATRSKGQATRSAGDALTGGVSLTPVEKGMTIMNVEGEEPTPSLAALMISRTNGTDLGTELEKGNQPKIIQIERFQFRDGIDDFIKRDLPKMMNEMEVYSNVMRESKDDMTDPILTTLKRDREAFAAAVGDKKYGVFSRAFQTWMDHLDPKGRFKLSEDV